jgi:ABC-type branched-subunit amino acid transport system ATPase component
MDAALLAVSGLTLRFGGLAAVDRLDLAVSAGEIVGLIGPNGSGKTTALNVVSGFLKPDDGRVEFGGRDITGFRPDRIARGGLVRTFQEARVFPTLALIENLLLPGQQHQEDNLALRMFPSRRLRNLEADARRRAHELLEFVELGPLANHLAGSLSYGQKKLLMLAAALMPNPRLVLLDEPTAGVNPTLIAHLKRYIVELNGQGLSVLLVEHNMEVVMEICHRVVVLNFGRVIADGSTASVREDPNVIEAFFGT